MMVKFKQPYIVYTEDTSRESSTSDQVSNLEDIETKS